MIKKIIKKLFHLIEFFEIHISHIHKWEGDLGPLWEMGLKMSVDLMFLYNYLDIK